MDMQDNEKRVTKNVEHKNDQPWGHTRIMYSNRIFDLNPVWNKQPKTFSLH